MVKVVGTRSLERLGECTVFRSPSESRPGLFHLTVVHSNGSIRCSCEGFCLQGHCWHIDAIPLCMKWGVYDPNLKRGTIQCYYVQGHNGNHSWGTDVVAPEVTVEEYKPNEGLPQ